MSAALKISLCLLGLTTLCLAKVNPKVRCSPDKMRVEVPLTPGMKAIYLQGLKDYPDPACQASRTESLAVLELDLRDPFQCAVTRVTNERTGKQVYYQTVIIESETAVEGGDIPLESREVLQVKCSVATLRNHTISRRDVLPAGFQEPEELEITTSLTEKAPEPQLGVGVRQGGKLVTGELNVSPGTPLQMEIFLDKASATVYGLLVTHMQVTDTKAQEETIIFNGCSVDPYLFENFNTVDGDFLSAKFRAFKFPESTYVQFKGTVNVCLDKCKGIECSDGQIGYGRRRRRALASMPADPNKIFEITITSFIKVNYDDDTENFEEVIKNKTTAKIHNTKKFILGGGNGAGEVVLEKKETKTIQERQANMGIAQLTEEMQYTAILAENSSAQPASWAFLAIALVALVQRLFA